MVRISTVVMILGIALFLLPLPVLPPIVSGGGLVVFVAGVVLRLLGM
ncbi:transporter [Halalkalicoccus ordinarius]